MLGHYAKIAVGLTVLLGAVMQFAKYRSAIKNGMSRSEYILRDAGGAEKLLKKIKRNRLIAYLSICGPFAWFLVLTKPFAFDLTMFIIFEVIFLPVALLFLWDARSSQKIAEGAIQEKIL